MSFGEDTNGLIGKRDGVKFNSTLMNMLSNEMTINLNVFGTFMKDIIVGNLDSTKNIITKRTSCGVMNSHVCK